MRECVRKGYFDDVQYSPCRYEREVGINEIGDYWIHVNEDDHNGQGKSQHVNGMWLDLFGGILLLQSGVRMFLFHISLSVFMHRPIETLRHKKGIALLCVHRGSLEMKPPLPNKIPMPNRQRQWLIYGQGGYNPSFGMTNYHCLCSYSNLSEVSRLFRWTQIIVNAFVVKCLASCYAVLFSVSLITKFKAVLQGGLNLLYSRESFPFIDLLQIQCVQR